MHCRPPTPAALLQSQTDAGEQEGPTREGTGMGEGSTKGAKDVSDELDNEDQLLGTNKEEKEEQEDEAPQDNEDAKGRGLAL